MLSDLQQLAGPYAVPLVIVVALATFTSSIFLYLFARPSLPKSAPRTIQQWPILGAFDFFSQRWDFVRTHAQSTPSHNFTFFAGQKPVVTLMGEDERKVFFEHKGLSFADGYSAMLGGSPPTETSDEASAYFIKRLIAMLKGPVLKQGLPQMMKDVRYNLDKIAAEPTGTTDPFQSIYSTVFQLTMRAVACNEIANDPVTLKKCLTDFETIDKTGTALTIMYPWLPMPAKFRRLKAGASLFMVFRRIIEARKKEERREEDALQYLMDQGDDVKSILGFVVGALFAGQLNSGINASFILCYLACNPDWQSRVRAEVLSVADKYCAEQSLPLKERLMRVPIEAWEGEFPMIDLCLKDTIRMHMPGTAFRRNTSGEDIPIGKNGETIPNNAYVAFPVGDVFYNPEIYTKENEWDPGRYLPERAEDKKQAYAWMGWGVARHPCLGMRFAKLENNLIVAFFLAYFDEMTLLDGSKNALSRVPDADRNAHSASKPKQQLYLKVR